MMFPGQISGQRVAWIPSAIILLSCFLPGSVRAQAPQSPVAPPQAAAESAPSKLPPEALNHLLAPHRAIPGCSRRLDPSRLDGAVGSRACTRGLYLQMEIRRRSGISRGMIVSSRLRAIRTLSSGWTRILSGRHKSATPFSTQPADVMDQSRLFRAPAIAAGTLVDCPQQRVVKETDCIRIVPAEPDLIYVPQYIRKLSMRSRTNHTSGGP